MVMELKGNSFIHCLENWPKSKVLMVEDGREFTADELFKGSISIAAQLKKNGVQQGDRVVVAVKPGAEFLMLIFANMLVRAVVSIIDPEMGKENYAAKLKQFEPSHAFVDSRLILLNEHPILKFILGKLKPSLPFFPKTKNCQLFTLGKKLPIFKRHIHLAHKKKYQGKVNIIVNTNPNEDFLVTYTSGTLAEPKGVVHTYESLGETIRLLTALLDKNGDERIATHLPHFMLLGVNAGRLVYLWDNELAPDKKLGFIERNKITTIFGPPGDFVPIMKELEGVGKVMPKSIRNFYFGSAPVHASFLEKFERICNDAALTCLYGMTENLMVCIQDGKEKVRIMGQGDLVGKPFPGVKITIQEDGEIGVESKQKFKRYWIGENAADVHLSGDFGQMDAEGRLFLTGRKKDMIIRENFNIYPGLYEPTINKIPGVAEAIMLGVYDAHKHDETVYLIVEGEMKITESALLRLLKNGAYSIDIKALPDVIIYRKLERFGRQNKVDRKKMRAQLLAEMKS
jgi:acyl-coenzyme A synthetase/AMP-(fatty) acid ligase